MSTAERALKEIAGEVSDDKRVVLLGKFQETVGDLTLDDAEGVLALLHGIECDYRSSDAVRGQALCVQTAVHIILDLPHKRQALFADFVNRLLVLLSDANCADTSSLRGDVAMCLHEVEATFPGILSAHIGHIVDLAMRESAQRAPYALLSSAVIPSAVKLMANTALRRPRQTSGRQKYAVPGSYLSFPLQMKVPPAAGGRADAERGAAPPQSSDGVRDLKMFMTQLLGLVDRLPLTAQLAIVTATMVTNRPLRLDRDVVVRAVARICRGLVSGAASAPVDVSAVALAVTLRGHGGLAEIIADAQGAVLLQHLGLLNPTLPEWHQYLLYKWRREVLAYLIAKGVHAPSPLRMGIVAAVASPRVLCEALCAAPAALLDQMHLAELLAPMAVAVRTHRAGSVFTRAVFVDVWACWLLYAPVCGGRGAVLQILVNLLMRRPDDFAGLGAAILRTVRTGIPRIVDADTELHLRRLLAGEGLCGGAVVVDQRYSLSQIYERPAAGAGGSNTSPQQQPTLRDAIAAAEEAVRAMDNERGAGGGAGRGGFTTAATAATTGGDQGISDLGGGAAGTLSPAADVDRDRVDVTSSHDVSDLSNHSPESSERRSCGGGGHGGGDGAGPVAHALLMRDAMATGRAGGGAARDPDAAAPSPLADVDRWLSGDLPRALLKTATLRGGARLGPLLAFVHEWMAALSRRVCATLRDAHAARAAVAAERPVDPLAADDDDDADGAAAADLPFGALGGAGLAAAHLAAHARFHDIPAASVAERAFWDAVRDVGAACDLLAAWMEARTRTADWQEEAAVVNIFAVALSAGYHGPAGGPAAGFYAARLGDAYANVVLRYLARLLGSLAAHSARAHAGFLFREHAVVARGARRNVALGDAGAAGAAAAAAALTLLLATCVAIAHRQQLHADGAAGFAAVDLSGSVLSLHGGQHHVGMGRPARTPEAATHPAQYTPTKPAPGLQAYTQQGANTSFAMPGYLSPAISADAALNASRSSLGAAPRTAAVTCGAGHECIAGEGAMGLLRCVACAQPTDPFMCHCCVPCGFYLCFGCGEKAALPMHKATLDDVPHGLSLTRHPRSRMPPHAAAESVAGYFEGYYAPEAVPQAYKAPAPAAAAAAKAARRPHSCAMELLLDLELVYAPGNRGGGGAHLTAEARDAIARMKVDDHDGAATPEHPAPVYNDDGGAAGALHLHHHHLSGVPYSSSFHRGPSAERGGGPAAAPPSGAACSMLLTPPRQAGVNHHHATPLSSPPRHPAAGAHTPPSAARGRAAGGGSHPLCAVEVHWDVAPLDSVSGTDSRAVADALAAPLPVLRVAILRPAERVPLVFPVQLRDPLPFLLLPTLVYSAQDDAHGSGGGCGWQDASVKLAPIPVLARDILRPCPAARAVVDDVYTVLCGICRAAPARQWVSSRTALLDAARTTLARFDAFRVRGGGTADGDDAAWAGERHYLVRVAGHRHVLLHARCHADGTATVDIETDCWPTLPLIDQVMKGFS